MTAPIQQLIAAAKLAREASQGRRTIELVVTEEGVIARGWTLVDGKKYNAWAEVEWRDMDGGATDLLSNVVYLVDRKLSAAEGGA